MVGLRHGAGVIAAIGTVVLAGCGGGVSAAGTPPATSSRPTSTVSSAPPRSSAVPHPTASGPGAPGVPAAARHHTKAGAIAFAKYYLDKVSDTGVEPKVGVLEPLADSACRTCAKLAKSVKNLAARRQHYSARVEDVKEARRLKSESGMVIDVLVDQPHIDVLNSRGKVVNGAEAVTGSGLVFFLRWSSSGWRVHEIEVDTSRAS